MVGQSGQEATTDSAEESLDRGQGLPGLSREPGGVGEARMVGERPDFSSIRLRGVCGRPGCDYLGLASARVSGRTSASPLQRLPPKDLVGFESVAVGKDGVCSIPMEVDQTLEVIVQDRTHFGWGYFAARAGDAEQVLELAHDARLLVRVVRASGLPASGLEVSVFSPGEPELSLQGKTDDRGTAIIEYVGWLSSRGRSAPLRVSLAGQKGRGFVQDFALPTNGPDPFVLDLTLPPTGTVEVLLEAHEGFAHTEAVQVSLGRAGKLGSIALQTCQATTRASFDNVEIGQRYVASARRGPDVLGQVAFDGPAEEGAAISVNLPLSWQRLLLAPIDPAGRPLVDEPIRISGSDGILVELDTNHAGVLEVYCGGDLRPSATPDLELFARSDSLHASVKVGLDAHPARAGAVPTPVQMLEFPVLAAGRVSLGTRAASGARVGWEVPGAGATWLPVAEVRCDEAGQFAVRGSPTVRDLRLIARFGVLTSAPLVTPAGAQGLELDLRTSASLRGSVHCTESFVLEKVELALRAMPGTSALPSSARTRPTFSGGFLFEGLAAGEYALIVRVEGLGDLLEFSNLAVRPGEECHDERVQDIELPLRGCRLHFNKDGSPVRAEGNLNFRSFGLGSAEGNWENFSASFVDLVTRSAALDVDLQARGYRVRQLRGVIGEQVVDLEECISVELVLDESIPIPAAPLALRAALTTDDGLGSDFFAPAFDASRRVRVRAPGVGVFRVLWTLEERTATGLRAESMSLGKGQAIEIRETSDVQSFELDVNAAELEQALQLFISSR